MKDLLVDSTIDNAIDEINRTTDEIDKLRELNRELVEALKKACDNLYGFTDYPSDFEEELKRLIAKAEANNE